MNTFSRTLAASLLAASTSGLLTAQEHHHHEHSAHDGADHHHHHHDHAVAGGSVHHAPAGIMVPHTHGQGSWMLGYSYMHMSMSGLRSGSQSFAEEMLPHHGYSMAPVSMDMDMHMLHVMYGLTERITLMVMPQYTRMDMTMRMLDVQGGGHGGHGGGGHHMPGMVHSHSVSGMDDTVVAAYITLWTSGSHALVAQAGLSIPTGDVAIKTSNGTFTHYDMQIGSGTWDAKPGLTYTGSHGRFTWGAQGTLTLRLEDENESGYQRGNVRELSSWLSYGFLEWASLSGRLNYRHEGRLSGHYNGPHGHSSPADLQQNYGGEILEGGPGLTVVIPTGPLAGHQFGIEALWALKEDYNGIQLGRDYTIAVAWNKAF